jgi:pimeloyl-ACP methyl ester carboxylesterase
MAGPRFRPSDLQGLAQLATQATSGVARVAEGVTQSVWGTLGLPGGPREGQTRGLTGQVFRAIEGINQLAGKGAQAVLGSLLPLLQTVEEPAQSFAREAVLAALNGVLGDRLHDSNNPLASRMGLFRVQDQVSVPWNASAIAAGVQSAQAPPSGKILILIHGLCMNELQWTPSGQTGHADALAAQLGHTALYVRYNTGLHIAQNGQALSELLEQLVRQWPVPVEEITLLTHSMGGLVARSAVECAKPRWRAALKNMIFLGTPHQGAPLEKAGNWIDVILGSTPYSRPFAKLGQLRSAGITDLRYGHVAQADGRHVVPLPEGVACYAVAATLAPKRSPLSERVLGDGLVPLPSALGQHDEPARQLKFAKDSVFVAYRKHHMQLLHSREVTTRLLQWLAPPTASGD